MRDPGTPRRNPFFEHGSEGSTDDFGMGWRDPDDAADDGATTRSSGMPDGGVGAFATLVSLAEALAEALGEAQPEAAEHVVAAAHEVVLTIKVLVDATEAVLAQQRAAMAVRNDVRDTDDVAPISMLHRTEGS